MSDNWVVQNLENALNTWNEKLAEIWQLITQSPENFKGGTIWNVIVDIHGAVQAIGLALLVLFFVVGVMRTCGNFAEVKRPEQALKLFIRFAIAKGAVTYGLELMMALFKIVQGMISTIMNAAGFGSAQQTVLPQEIVTAVEDCGFFESIPLWAVTLIGGLFITVLSFIMIMSVYGRFFKLYIYTAIAPVPLSTFAGEPSQSVGKSFIKSYAAVCLEGAVIVLACGVAVGLYFLLRPRFGTETLSWVCILGAFPFAAMGFIKYNGMTAEQFVWAWIKSEFLMPKKLMFLLDNLYYETMKPTIEVHEKRLPTVRKKQKCRTPKPKKTKKKKSKRSKEVNNAENS